MNGNRKTGTVLVGELKAACRRDGLSATARRFHFTVQFISDVVHGRRPVSARLAGAMGYRRVVEYERES